MTLQDAQKLARKAWEATRWPNNCGVICEQCLKEWEGNGRDPKNKPPLFPVDYPEECPMCGGKMRVSLFF